MNNHIQQNQKSTLTFSSLFFIFILLASPLSSCGAVIKAPPPTKSEAEITPTLESLATPGSTSILPTEVTTEVTPEIIIQKPTESGTNNCVGKNENECIFNEQFANDFLAKKIPLESDLKFLRDGINQEVFSKSMLIDVQSKNSSYFIRQAILIGGYFENENLIVYAGIEDDDGNRVILPMRANFGHVEDYEFNKIAFQVDDSGENRFITNAANIVQVSPLEFIKVIKEYLGKVCILNMDLYIDIDNIGKNRPELAQLLRDIYVSNEIFELNRIVAENPILLKDSTGDKYPYISYFQFFDN